MENKNIHINARLRVLAYISVHNAIQTNIYKDLDLTYSHVVKIIKEFENRGLVEKELNPLSRREYIIKLSDKGKEFMQKPIGRLLIEKKEDGIYEYLRKM